jgi:transposase
VSTYGKALLEADRGRLNKTTAIGLDETSFVKAGARSYADYATTVADVENHQVIDILPTRKFTDVAGWLDKQPRAWKDRIRFGALDMSATYAAVYTVILPKAAQVVDPFHVVTLANRCLDAVRRRVQSEQLGHRGRRDDPLYRARRALLVGEERLDQNAAQRLASLLELGDPGAEVAVAYRVKERLRDFYRASHPDQARAMLEDLQQHCNYHLAKMSNGPTESINNLIKRVKRVGFGFRNFENYRVRALLYAGRPNWRVLGSIVVR